MNSASSEFRYLIHLINAAIHSKKPQEKPPETDFAKVLAIAAAHDVANIAFYSIERLENKPSEEIYNRWQKLYLSSVLADIAQSNAYAEITDAFHKNSIRTLEAQGTLYKPLYPASEWRTMGDIDIIIDRENCEKAQKILDNIGYKTIACYNEDFNATGRDGVFVEIHYGYFYDDSEFYDVIPNPFEKSKKTNGEFSYAADDESFCLYGILHLLKHFNRSGCGIRRILDMYYLRQNFDLNTDYINSVLDRFGYRRLVDLIFSLCDAWFDDAPLCADAAKLEGIIEAAGTHGTSKNYYSLMELNLHLQGKHFIKFRCFMDKLLLDKERLYDISPFCKKHQLPVWVCRVLRLFIIIKNIFKEKKK